MKNGAEDSDPIVDVGVDGVGGVEGGELVSMNQGVVNNVSKIFVVFL